MKKHLNKLLFNIIFISLFVYFYLSNPDSLRSVLSMGIAFVIVMVLFQAVIMLVTDFYLKLIITRLGTKIGIVDGYYTAYLSSFGNYFLPLTGGAFLRAVYLKKNHNFSYKKFVSLSYGAYVITFLSISFTALVGLSVLYITSGQYSVLLTLIMLGLFILSATLILDIPKIDSFFESLIRSNKLSRKFIETYRDIADGWKYISKDRMSVFFLFSLAAANIVIRVVFYKLILDKIGGDTGIIQLLLYCTIVSLSTYLTITPGSLGIREAMLIFFTGTLSLTESEILTLSLVDRMTLLILLAVLYVIFTFVLRRRINFGN